MGISIVNCTETKSGETFWGVLQANKIYPLAEQYPSHRELMAAYSANPAAFKDVNNDHFVDAEKVQFNSPISADVQLFCQGLNYADHREESGMSVEHDEENLIFMKAASSICGPNDDIIRPADCELLDYEIELALVLKQGINAQVQIAESDLKNYVGGLVLCNDVSARDLMFGAPMLQWFRGKSQRTFCPLGPVLYLMDDADFDQLYSLELTLKWNGVVKQSASTSQLIHRPAKTLTDLSGFCDVQAGDCLLTGTPGGVLAGSNLKVGLSIITNMKNDQKRRKKFTQAQLAMTRFLQPGDTLELSIQSSDGAIDLGTQKNVIVGNS